MKNFDASRPSALHHSPYPVRRSWEGFPDLTAGLPGTLPTYPVWPVVQGFQHVITVDLPCARCLNELLVVVVVLTSLPTYHLRTPWLPLRGRGRFGDFLQMIQGNSEVCAQGTKVECRVVSGIEVPGYESPSRQPLRTAQGRFEVTPLGLCTRAARSTGRSDVTLCPPCSSSGRGRVGSVVSNNQSMGVPLEHPKRLASPYDDPKATHPLLSQFPQDGSRVVAGYAGCDPH